MLLGVADHLVHVILGEHRGGGDPDLLLFRGRPVLGLHVKDAVRVDVEGDLDLGHAARGGRDPVEDEATQRLVVRREVPLALQDMDLDLRLVVRRRREDLRLGRRDRGVPVDELRHHAAQRLDAERQRGDVEQEDVLDLAAENAGLDRGTDGHDLVRVDALVRLLAVEHRLDRVDDGRHPGLAADEDHLVDVGRREAGVLERVLDRSARLLDQIPDELLELRPRKGHDEVLWTRRIGRDVREVDLRRHRRGQLDLGLLGSLLEALEGLLVLREVDALVLLELGQQPLDDALVEVVAAEVGVTVGGLDLEDALAELEDRDVEGAAAQIVDGDLLVMLLVQPVCQGRSSRLVDDPLDVEAGDAACVLGGLALRVVEVGRDRDDRVGHLLAEVGLRVGPQLLKDHRADLGRGVALAVRESDADAVRLRILLDLVGHEILAALHLEVVPSAAHEALDRIDRVGGVGDRLALRQLADQPLAGLRERDDRRHRPTALRGRDDRRLAALHDGDDRVRRAEVDSDDLGHLFLLLVPC